VVIFLLQTLNKTKGLREQNYPNTAYHETWGQSGLLLGKLIWISLHAQINAQWYLCMHATLQGLSDSA